MKLLQKHIPFLLLILVINSSTVYAQLGFCTGNSGTPIFNQNFGTGTNYGPALPGGTTTYNFISNSGPQDGQYTIGSNTFSYGWNLPSDHTPNDTNGKCLIVNASFNSGEFYKTSITGLCENTTYEFSAWLINILPSSGCGGSGIPVNVKFEIWDVTDTNLLASGDTGNIFGSASPNWQQYGLVFQTLVSQTSVILKMLNNGVGGCGNDLAIDDIVFKTCGDRVVLEDNPGDSDFEACEDDMVTNVPLTATPDFSVFSTHAYQWQVSTDNTTWNDISGATTDSYNAPAPIPSGILYYRVKFAESASNLQNSSCNSISEIFQIKINALITPTFNPVGPICNGTTFNLSTTSINAISGTWSPAFDNLNTTTYTFTPNSGQCATIQTLTVLIDQPLTPTFAAIAPICNGDGLTLPTTSTNNINGTWSPTVNNTTTTTYTFTPFSGQCATNQTLTVVVNQPETPQFNVVAAICRGDVLAPLPMISTNGIAGNWSPALNTTATTTYTFTPSATECATTQTLTIVVNQPTLPTFNSVAAICDGGLLTPLPTLSTNGISGTWAPALDNSATTTYTFTPNTGQCATTQNLTIIVNPIVEPSFAPVPPICAGDFLSPLPTTSTNGITGTWTPAISNTTTSTYTFNPNIGECATTQTLTIVVNQAITPIFDSVVAICSGELLNPLPTISNNGISGTWSPELDNTMTTTYTFTPNQGECPILVPLTIIVNSGPLLNLNNTYVICAETNGTQVVQSPTIETNLSEADFTFIWTDDMGAIVSTESSFTPLVIGMYSVTIINNLTGCQSETSTTVIQSNPPTLEIRMISGAFSDNGSIEVSAIGNGIYEYSLDNGSWRESPVFSNVSSGLHGVTARDKNGCGFATIDVCLIGAPKFFTPNGDGINETWTINGSSCLMYANVSIFDRYGKLLKQFDLNSLGWNGTFNDENLPTSDYWFIIRYKETFNDVQKEFKGHFTLKR